MTYVDLVRSRLERGGNSPMRMYTELFISVSVQDDPEVLDVLKYLVGQFERPPEELPDHEFFKCQRWSMVLSSSSYYFVPRSMNLLEYDKISHKWVFISRSDLKNYDNEIQNFIDWITPFVASEKGEMMGYYRYEEDVEPSVFYKT